MKVKSGGVIYLDLDGTLLDSSYRHELLLSDILEEMNIRCTLENYLSFKREGFSTRDYLIMKKISNVDYIINEWIARIENEEYLKHDSLYPGIEIFLKDFSRKYSLKLLTARKEKERLTSGAVFKTISKYFMEVIIVNPNHASKEKAKVLMQDRDAVCFIGDTESDYEASNAAEVIFLATTYGFRSKKFWEKKISSEMRNIGMLIDDPVEINEFFKKN